VLLPAAPDPLSDPHLRKMCHALDCTPRDLVANRAGRLSLRQRRGQATGLTIRLLLAVVTAGLCSLFLLVTVKVIVNTATMEAGWPILLAIAIVFFVLLFLGFVRLLASIARIVAVLRDAAPVARATGSVTIEFVGEDYRQVTVGAIQLSIIDSRANAFAEPGGYAVYYLPGRSQLLSAEPAPEDAGSREPTATV
jgi:hypothetical protein